MEEVAVILGSGHGGLGEDCFSRYIAIYLGTLFL